MESPIIAKLPRGHRMDRQFGVVFDRAPAECDDLTRIDGVRTREAVLLNQMGIYLFGQIALWRHREIIAIASELQVPVSRIVDEGWMEQARVLTRPPSSSSTLPASILRTVVLSVCSLLIGSLIVYLFGQRHNPPLTGVLAADITSIRVPSPARMTAIHVKAGAEVFSGQPLLTLEKLEHLDIIAAKERQVVELGRELKRAEAQSAIEVEWRTRELDRELAAVRHEIAEWEASPYLQSRALNTNTRSPAVRVSPISARSARDVATTRDQSPGIVFFSGSSGQSTPAPVASTLEAVPMQIAHAPRENVVSDSGVVSLESSQLTALRAEQSRLETMRESLPLRISEAHGVTTLRAQTAEVTQQLETMKSVSREVKVQAPVFGVVGQIHYRVGDDLPEGEVMLRILHNDRRYIIVPLPTRRVHEMQPGRAVQLVFPGNQHYEGKIADIPLLADTTTTQPCDSLATVRIEPTGRLWPTVPIGSQVDVISLR